MTPTKPISTIADSLLDLAVKIQQVPAPTFREKQRAKLLRGLFAAEGLHDVALDACSNVYARLPGRSRSNPMIVTAHLDTVFRGRSIKVRREPDRIYGPGIGDNALGVAALLGLVWILRERAAHPSADLWLVANTGEEGLGDLRGMKAVVDRFGPDVRAYLVLEGTALGQIYHRAIGVQRFRVKIATAGGHSWSDYGQPSAVHELASLVNQLTALRLPLSPRTTLNVGTLAGGTGINVLASQAQFELDVRSESEDALASVVASIEHRIRLARRDGVAVEMSVIGHRPAGEIPADHRLVRLATECLAAEGLGAALTAGSTDANVPLSRGLPSVVLGVTTGGGAHTPHEYIDTPPVGQGMRQLANFVLKLMAA